MDQRWDDVRVFLAVARHGGLTGAGRVLKMDPATVGRHIVRLETVMDRPLFAKSPQGYALTPEGTRLLPRAEAMEAQLRAGLDGMAEGGDLTGAIRIGAPDGCANFLLPQVLAPIARDNPGLDLQVLALPRVVNLSRREADMAITVSRPTAGRLLVQKIADYTLHLAAHTDYLASAPPLNTPDDLRQHRLVGYIPDMIFDRELDYLSPLGLDRVPMASTSAAVQLQMLNAGAGVGVVHDFALPAGPDLRPVLTDHIHIERTFYLVRHADDRHSDRMSRVTSAVLQGMRAALA